MSLFLASEQCIHSLPLLAFPHKFGEYFEYRCPRVRQQYSQEDKLATQRMRFPGLGELFLIQKLSPLFLCGNMYSHHQRFLSLVLILISSCKLHIPFHMKYLIITLNMWSFPCDTVGKEFTCQCRNHKRPEFDPCIGKIPWNRKWQPTSVILPGEFHEQRSQAGYSPWGGKELDMTEQAHMCNLLCIP